VKKSKRFPLKAGLEGERGFRLIGGGKKGPQMTKNLNSFMQGEIWVKDYNDLKNKL